MTTVMCSVHSPDDMVGVSLAQSDHFLPPFSSYARGNMTLPIEKVEARKQSGYARLHIRRWA